MAEAVAVEILTLDAIGDLVAKTGKFGNLKGQEVLVRLLCDKHHWTPATVRGLSDAELRLLVEGEFAPPSTSTANSPKPKRRGARVSELRID